ncbi:type II toxin-antitoxin system prevent-host-death family antitoxin [Coleofasciculus sp. LEGE 07081]|uniref:type II toxin-antitoxin system Phd/YefM family antitoxin n=1 Tax=Coleofasciculus sp. LEGE 07081 TaxID=2777967 RepID=UPI00187FDE18|nr:type II toxin-antitoxin system prevent-host-death family antitoxin [Coleofasciculus sp. LEGE 07081]MBE9130278.1 type II toxin-antitoxin system prevent-host-death family antitoxin [Coleofasciculus sp. LEGE 07081]
MIRKSITEAKAELSRLVVLMEQGEEIILTRSGKEVARIVPTATHPKKRVMGLAKGEIWISPDFDKVDEEIEKLMLGEE